MEYKFDKAEASNVIPIQNESEESLFMNGVAYKEITTPNEIGKHVASHHYINITFLGIFEFIGKAGTP